MSKDHITRNIKRTDNLAAAMREHFPAHQVAPEYEGQAGHYAYIDFGDLADTFWHFEDHGDYCEIDHGNCTQKGSYAEILDALAESYNDHLNGAC